MKKLLLLVLIGVSELAIGQNVSDKETRYPEVEASFCRECPFPGGQQSLNNFLASNLDFNGVPNFDEIVLYARFTLDASGNAYNLRVENAVTKEVTAELQRVFVLMPKWMNDTVSEVRIPIRVTWIRPNVYTDYPN